MQGTKLTNKRLFIFLSLATGFLAICSFMYSQDKDPKYLVWLMFTPMISVVITRILTKEGLKNSFLKPFFKKNKNYYLMAYLVTPFIAFFGALIYFLLFPNQIDLLSSKFALQSGLTSTDDYFKNLILLIPLCILVNPFGGLLSSLGEEFAWRGYVLPKLTEKFSTKKAVILTGLIWGIWHAPIIYMGFNYGTEHPIFGIFMMIFFCTIINIILSYLFLKTSTIWVVVVAHAAINAIDQYTPSYLFTSIDAQSNFFIGPNLVGLIGGLGFIILAFFCYRKLAKNSQQE